MPILPIPEDWRPELDGTERLARRVKLLERATAGTLPAKMVLALAEDPSSSMVQLSRAAVALARRFDLSPSFLLRHDREVEEALKARRAPAAWFVDPVSGGPISWATAKRIARPWEPARIAQMLQGLVEGGARPELLAEIVKALAPISGEDVPAEHVLGAVARLAEEARREGQENVFVWRFGRNLEVVSKLRAIEPPKQIAIAQLAAARGVVLQDAADVARFLFPEAREAISLAEQPPPIVAERQIARLTREGVAFESLPLQEPRTPQEQTMAVLGAGLIGALEAKDLAAALQEAQDDYIAAAREIAARAVVPFSDTMVGHVLLRALDYVSRPFSAAMRGLWGVSEAISTPITAHMEGPAGNRPIAEVFGDMVHDMGSIIVGNTTHVKELEELGVPPWAVVVVDLFALKVVPEIDPLIAAGKIGQARAEMRTMFGLAERGREGEWAKRVHDWLHRPVGRIGDLRGVTPAEYLLREADRSRDAATAYARAVANFRATYSTEGINPIVAEAIWRFARESRKTGWAQPARVDAVKRLLAYALGVRTESPLIAEVERAYEGARTELIALRTRIAADFAAEEKAVSDLQRVLGVLSDAETSALAHGPAMVEIPHTASPIVRAEHALRSSGLADTVPGRAARSLFQMHPRRAGGRFEFELEDVPGAVRDFERYLLSSKVFSLEEIERAKLHFAKLIRPANPLREVTTADMLARYESEVLFRLGRKYGLLPRLDPAQRDRLIKDAAREGWTKALARAGVRDEAVLFSKIMARFERIWGGNPTMVFGGLEHVAGERTVFTAPILASQRPNVLRVIDPILFERGVAETIGTARKLRASLLSSLGAQAPRAREVTLPLRKVIDHFADLLIRDLFLRFYKPLVVVRGAYVLRVPGIEEQTRFLATLGMARRLSASKTTARIENFSGALLARGSVFEIPITMPDGELVRIALPRPGLLPDEPLANSVASRFALASERSMHTALLERLVPNKWGLIEQTEEHYTDFWFNALVHQYGLDPMGRMVLRDIAAGLSEPESVQRIVRWLYDAKGEGPGYLQRLLGRPAKEVPMASAEAAVIKAVSYGRHLTQGSRELARAAASGALRAADLAQIPREQAPLFVHGPLAAEGLLAGGVDVARRMARGMAYAILQWPTNVLSRQPYYKAWYDRVLRAMVRTHLEAGGKITPELYDALRIRARAFAVDQVKRIMFDFTREGRLDEVTRNVLMFVQPYLEWPVVWSRIVRQNPAVIGWAVRLAKSAHTSGVVREDPETGELVVPLSWWMGAAPLLAAVTGGRLRPIGQGGGWELIAPLSAFNLFAQSAFPVPTGAMLAGDIPIPMPSVQPEAMWVLQQLISHDLLVPGELRADIKARISAWAFAYGPVDPAHPASLLPPYLRQLILAAMPEWLEREHDLATTNFLQLQEVMGITPEAVMADHPSWSRQRAQAYLRDLAERQAREFALLRAFFSFTFPASPRISFPTEELEREWSALASEHDIDEAKRIWFERHPDLRLLTVARTMWATENPTPVPIPPTRLVAQFLQTRGARRFAETHPRWVWAIITGELASSEWDIGQFFAQVAAGQREVLSPSAFQESADVQAGWDAYFLENERWVAWGDAHPDLGPGDPPYEAERSEHDRALEEIGQLYPAWRAEYNVIQRQGVDPSVMAEARRLAKDKLFVRTEVGKGLVEYLQLRDGIAEEMRQMNITSVRTATAERLGFRARYDDGVADIIARYPSFRTAYRLFFYSDLQRVPARGQQRIDAVPDAVMARITTWWETFERLRRAPDLASTDAERASAYEELRAFVARAYEEFGPHNPMRLRWDSYDPRERAAYAISLAGRGYWYMSRFDRELLGEETSEATERFWSIYNAARAEITKRRLSDPGFVASEAYRRLDAWVRDQMRSDPLLAAQVEHANTWGYGVQRLLPEMLAGGPGEARAYWDALFSALREVQALATRYELTGESSLDAKERVAYATLRKIVSSYVDELREASVVFARQWDELETANGSEPLLDALMPETYFPVGGFEGGKR